MRTLAFISILLLTLDTFGQSDCGMIGKTRNKNFKEGTAYGEMVPTKDSYTVMYEKIINTKDTANYPQYMISMTCAARHPLPDSILARTGVIQITFDDQSTTNWTGTKCSNVPTLPVWNFELRLTEGQFEILTQKKIESIRAFGIVTTSLSSRNQDKLLKIANCLKIR